MIIFSIVWLFCFADHHHGHRRPAPPPARATRQQLRFVGYERRLRVGEMVTRRAERYYWTLRREVASTHPVPDAIGIYLNRLSDLCFSWARLANKGASVADIPWTRSDSEQSS